MSEYEYYFEKRGRGQVEGPNDPKATHFRDETAETSLTREMIQNALDARDEDIDGPVTVEFELRDFDLTKLRGFDQLAEAAIRAYEEHKDAQGASGLERVVTTLSKAHAHGSIPTLRIGDSGTTGLTGSENDFSSPDARLAKLTRADGLSSDDDRGGSFGIGSSAARIASDLRTVAYVTKPKDADETVYASLTYLAGWRDKDGVARRASGFFTKKDLPGEEEVEYLRGVTALDGFAPRTTNGTDVYVLGASTFAEDPGLDRLRSAAIENFLVAIWHERLVVKGISQTAEWVLDRESLRGFIDADLHLTEQVLPFYLALTEGEVRHGTTSKLGKVRLHVLAGPDVTAKWGTMTMRAPLMRIDVLRTTLPLNFAAIFICDDPKGNRALRELEPPKHNKWSPKTPDGKSGNQVVYQQVTDFIREKLKEFLPEYDEAEFVFEGLEDLLPANFDFANRPPSVSSGGSEVTGEATEEESGVELGKPEQATDDIAAANGQSLEVQQPATSSEEAEEDEAESGTHTGGGQESHETGGQNETQASEDPPGDSVLRRRDLTFRSFAEAKGKATVVIKAQRDLEGALPLFAIGSVSSEPIVLKSASTVRADGSNVPLAVDGHKVLDIALKKDATLRLSIEFAQGSRYRLGVGNG